MQYYTFDIMIEKELEDEGYLAYSPSLPECTSNGSTLEEARRNIRQVLEQHIETLQAKGWPISQQFVIYRFYTSMN